MSEVGVRVRATVHATAAGNIARTIPPKVQAVSVLASHYARIHNMHKSDVGATDNLIASLRKCMLTPSTFLEPCRSATICEEQPQRCQSLKSGDICFHNSGHNLDQQLGMLMGAGSFKGKSHKIQTSK